MPRSCATGATLLLSKLCHCLNRLVYLAPFTIGVSVAVAVLVHLHREESHNPRVHRFANDVEQVGAALVRSVSLTRTRSLVRAQHVTMVISAFVRPLHAVIVHHSRYQSIQNDILPPLGGWWWFASGNSGLCFQQYIASYAEAISSVLYLALASYKACGPNRLTYWKHACILADKLIYNYTNCSKAAYVPQTKECVSRYLLRFSKLHNTTIRSMW